MWMLVRRSTWTLLGSALLAGPALGADKPMFAPAPAWVTPTAPQVAVEAQAAMPLQVLHSDEQAWFHGDTTSMYHDSAIKVLRPEALTALGTVAVQWKPDSDRLTVHGVRIRRSEQVIDVLGDGHALTILQREHNLETAMLDGVLTATMQLPGLQAGDIVELAYTIDRTEPLLQGHHDLVYDAGSGAPVANLSLAVRWDPAHPAAVNAVALPVEPVRGKGGVTMQAVGVTPPVMPQGAPDRFRRGRQLQVSDYQDWQTVSAVFTPLFDAARKPAADSPLHAEIARIRAASANPLVRAGMALALVEDQVRYLFLGFNDSNLRPAQADQTWQRRFGDCKAKTALLLALLDGLGIDAEPALASVRLGDGLDKRLPGIAWFDHVLVRATIGGKVYWLDGTRIGDRGLAALKVPNLHWVLPLHAGSGKLEALVVPPVEKPTLIHELHLDARGGLTLPAPAHGEATFTGDAARGLHMQLAALPPAQHDQALTAWWHSRHDFITATKVGESWDEAAGVEKLSLDGTARMEWNLAQGSPYYEIDGGSVGWRPDYHREAGPDADAPFELAYPEYAEYRETVELPGDAAAFHLLGADVDIVLAQRAIHRHTELKDGRVSMVAWHKPLAPELEFNEALAAEPRLRELVRDIAYIGVDRNRYETTGAEIDATLAKPDDSSEQGFFAHLFALQARGHYADALAVAKRFVAAYPKSAMALAQRGIALSLTGDDAGARADVEAALALQADLPTAKQLQAYYAARSQPGIGANSDMARANFLAFSNWGWARTCYARGDMACTLSAANRALAIEPLLTDAYVLRANALKRTNRAGDAAGEARRMIAAAPRNAEMLAVAGVILCSLGRTDEGMSAFAASLAVKPNLTALTNRYRFLPASDRVGRKRDIDAAIALDPHDETAQLALVEWQRQQGDAAGAVKTLEAFVAGQKGGMFANPQMGMQLGSAYARAGMSDKARAQFGMLRGYAAGTHNAEDYNNLCYAQAKANFDLDTALEDCRQAVAMRSDGRILDSLGFVELRMGRFDDAIADYGRALAASPKLAEALYGRGIARLRRGDRAMGEADLAGARASDPGIDAVFAGLGVKP